MTLSNRRHPILLFLIIYSVTARAQYVTMKPARELTLAGANTIWTGLNYAWQLNSPVNPAGRDWKTVWPDKYAVFHYSPSLASLSNYTLTGTAVLAGLSMMGKDRDQFVGRSIVFMQSAWLTANVVHTTKMIFLRRRPYTHDPGFVSTRRYDNYSFFSGHSALAASMITSAILMYSPEKSNPCKKWFIGGAVLLGGTTAVLRLKSGKHYPTDILTGIFAGMGIAYLNYLIHEK